MASSAQYGSYVPSTNIWDIPELSSVQDPSARELLLRLYQNINRISLVINDKDTGFYNTNEYINGQLYFPNPATTSANANSTQFRQVSRKVINFGALPGAAGTKSVAHNIIINSSFSFTRIYATASDQTGLNFIPIPYASSVLVNNIELSVDSTNVNITVGSNRSNFTITYVVLEYLTS